MHILCVEDNPADAELVERLTTASQYQGTFVNNLEAARAVLQENMPDLILMDLVLNQARVGIEFVRELRAQGYTQPIVALTGLAFPHEVQECYDAGCTEVVTKPYNIRQLGDIFARYLE